MDTSMLAQELATLDARIGRVRQKQEALEGELRVVEAELETFSAERQRIDALRDVCKAFDRLGDLKADDLLWDGGAEGQDTGGHVERARSRVARFDGEIGGILEKQASLQGQINQCLDELDFLHEEVRDAHDREERRQEEFVIEREVSSVPYREMIMPWTREAESERRFRRTVLVALFLCFVLGVSHSSDKSAHTGPLGRRAQDSGTIGRARQEGDAKARTGAEAGVESVAGRFKTGEERIQNPGPDQHKPEPEPEPVAGGGGGAPAARKAEDVGVLKFRNAFRELDAGNSRCQDRNRSPSDHG